MPFAIDIGMGRHLGAITVPESPDALFLIVQVSTFITPDTAIKPAFVITVEQIIGIAAR